LTASPGGLPADLASAVDSAIALLTGLRQQTASFSTVEDALNALQQVAVDVGLEPAQAQQAVLLLEWLAPAVRALYAAGVIAGGVPDAFPPGGGPSPYHGR